MLIKVEKNIFPANARGIIFRLLYGYFEFTIRTGRSTKKKFGD